MRIDFVTWLTNEMADRGWRNSDLAKRSGMSSAMVSQVLSQQRQAGLEFCVGVARALGLPPEHVLQKAGLVPSVPQTGDFSPEVQADIDQMLRYIAAMAPESRKAVTEQLVNMSKLAADLAADRERVG